MDLIFQSGYFILGIVFTALINESIKRFFNYPNVDAAISQIDLTRSTNKYHNTIPVPFLLKEKLIKHGTLYVKHDDSFTNEYHIEMSILQIIEEQKLAELDLEKINTILKEISIEKIEDIVFEIAINNSLIAIISNSLLLNPIKIDFNFNEENKVFDILKVPKNIDGTPCEFIYLELGGFIRSLLGSSHGDISINQKRMPFINGLAHCDVDVTRIYLENAKAYCENLILRLNSLREEFKKLQTEKFYLTTKLILTNTGKTSAFLSTQCSLTIDESGDIALKMVDFDENVDQQKISVIINDNATRLREWSPDLKDRLSSFESQLKIISIGPGETQKITFVSANPVSDDFSSALNALKDGYITCDVTFEQYTSRKKRNIPRLGRYSRKINTRQKLL
ncbi:MAG: hypothetical protein ACMZ7B_06035 [Balneola sp.]